MKQLTNIEIERTRGGEMKNCRCYDDNNEYVISKTMPDALECEDSMCNNLFLNCAYWEYEYGAFSSTGRCR